MNCGDCGTKLITISSNHGIVAYCPKCVPSVEHAFSSRGEPMICIKRNMANRILELFEQYQIPILYTDPIKELLEARNEKT